MGVVRFSAFTTATKKQIRRNEKAPVISNDYGGFVLFNNGGEIVRQIKIHQQPIKLYCPLFLRGYKPIIVSRHLPTFVTFLAFVGEQMGEQTR